MTQSVETSCQKSYFVINKASSSVLLCLNHNHEGDIEKVVWISQSLVRDHVVLIMHQTWKENTFLGPVTYSLQEAICLLFVYHQRWGVVLRVLNPIR